MNKILGGCGLQKRSHVAIPAAAVLCFGCGAPSEQFVDSDPLLGQSQERATSTNAPGATAPAVTNQENGTPYSVELIKPNTSPLQPVCSATMVNPWYLLTDAHCNPPSTIQIGLPGPATLTGGGWLNNFVLASGTYHIATYTPTAWASDKGSWNDVMLIEITDPVGLDTCEYTDCGVDKPINARLALGPRKQYGVTNQDALEMFGWGKGQDNQSNDFGFNRVQRHSTLHFRGQNFKALDSWTQTGGNPIPRLASYMTYDGELGYYVCDGDSGAPLLHQVVGTAWVTYGFNKSGLDDNVCLAGGVSHTTVGDAFQPVDFSIAQLIFQRERINGYVTAGDPNSGRFKCKRFNNVDPVGEMNYYWFCDNGHRFTSWSPAFTKNPANPYILNFNTAQDYDEFDYVTPTPNTLGPSNWQWAANGTLFEPTDVYGTGSVSTGTDAIHSTLIAHNGSVAVKVNSPDTGYAGLYIRYVDDTHFYRFAYGTWGCGIYARNGNTQTTLATCPVATGFNNVTLKFGAVGTNLTAWVNGSPVAIATDTQYAVGRTGIYKSKLNNTSFDDYTVTVQ